MGVDRGKSNRVPMSKNPTRRWFRFVAGGIVVAVIAGQLAALEYYIRQKYSRNKWGMYAELPFLPERYELNLKGIFVGTYSEVEQLWKRVYDPKLGWDWHVEDDRIRGDRRYEVGKRVPRIVTIGDSFTWGAEVHDHQCYPFFLEQELSGVEVLNMGVNGYGIDQAVLKYLEHGRRYAPRVVILGIFIRDYDRVRVSQQSFAKPLFVFDAETGNYELRNTPVPPPDDYYKRVKQQYEHTRLVMLPFLDSRLQLAWAQWVDRNAEQRYYNDTDRLNEFLLRMLKEDVENHGSHLLIVHIPPGVVFRNDGLLEEHERDPRRVRLLKVYKKTEIPYVDVFSHFQHEYRRAEVLDSFYIHRRNGSIGHFTAKGNHTLARIVAREIANLVPCAPSDKWRCRLHFD